MSSAADARVGTELAGYRLEALLGRGGMGVVYRARDLALDRDVALKLLAPHLAEDVSFRERFLTESRVAASLEHPNVVPIHDAGEIDGQLYIVMRLVVGSDLKVVLRGGALEPARAVGIVEQIASALDAAHARGLVHRDVKPSNVLLDEHGHVYLADFGLSRYLGDAAASLGPGRSLGTADYVAPEQIRCEEVDGRTDVYALGCLLYETLAGAPPFRRNSDAATLYAQLEDDPPTLPGLEEVLPKALAKDPAARYPTCGELIADARQALGITEPKRNPWPLAAAAVGIALIAAALAGYFMTQKADSVPPGVPGADTLVRIDPTKNAVSETFPVGRKTSGIAVGDGRVWVTSFGDGTAWRIDPKTRKSVVIPVRGSPTGIAAGQGSVLVANGPEHKLVSLDPVGGTVAFITPLQGDASGNVAVAAGREGIWFADATGGVAGTIEASFNGGGVGSQVDIPADRTSFLSTYEAFDSIAVGKRAIWVAGDAFGRTVWRIDPSSQRVVATIALPFVPASLAATDGAVWVTSLLDDTVVKINPSSNRIERPIRVGRGVNGIAASERAVWVTSAFDRTVSRIDPRTNRVVARMQLDGVPEQIAMGDGGVWVTTAKPAPAVAAKAIGVGVLADCNGPFKGSYEDALGGAELALLLHGGRRAGRQVTAGVSGVRIDGKPLKLVFGCTNGTTASTLAEARRLVEQAGVRVLIGPLGGDEGLALQEYERRQPGIAFVNGGAASQQLDPPPNFFSFHSDGAGFMAGLADYAYHELGWRRAVTVTDLQNNVFNWTQSAGFIAEFCSLGGTIAKRIWVPPGTQDYSGVIAEIPKKGVDGLVAASGAPTLLALAKDYPGLDGSLAPKLIGGTLSFGPALGRLGTRFSGIVGASPFLSPHEKYARYAADLHAYFPRLTESYAPDLFYHDGMAAVLQALERVHGDLSKNEHRFMTALATLPLDSPSGRIRLDRRHEAISPNYLMRFRTWKDGSFIRQIDGVEHTFNGYFSENDPPPSKTTPACVKRTPPPWAR